MNRASEWVRRALEGDLSPLTKACVLAAWAAITLLVAANHEPWRDEADAWLFARDHDGGLASLRAFTSGGGTPALWYVLLMPLAKAGLPYGAMTALHWVLGAAVVWLIVWQSPLPPLLRLVLPFGFLLGYEYVVVARSYALTLLLLLLSAALHAHRRERPLCAGLLIGLLANTSSHGFFLALGLGLGLAAEVAADRAPRRVAGAGLALALGLAALWQLWPRPDGQALPQVTPSAYGLLQVLTGAFFPDLREAPNPFATRGVVLATVAMLASVAIIASIARGVAVRTVRAALLVGLAGLLSIFVFKYVGSVRHHGLVQGLVMWAVWVDRAAIPPATRSVAERRLVAVALVGWTLATLASVPATAVFWARDLREPFSGSLEAARFLRAAGRDGETIAAHPPNEGEAVLPYLRARTFWYPGLERPGSHMPWDASFSAAQRLPVSEAAERTARRFSAGTLLLLSKPLPDPERQRLRYTLIFRSSRAPFCYDEVFWIYRLDDAAAVDRR